MPKVKTTNAKPITDDMEKTIYEDNDKKSKVKVKMFEDKKVDKKNVKTKKKKY